MSKTEINVAQARKNPGCEVEAELGYIPDGMSICGRPIIPEGTVRVALTYSCDGDGGVNVKGHITAGFREKCARCGKDMTYPLECDFDERFVRDTGEEKDEDAFSFTGDVIDLSDLIREFILLNYPICAVCDEQCRGLCPICGHDLNLGECSCGEKVTEIDHDDENAFDRAMDLLKTRFTVN